MICLFEYSNLSHRSKKLSKQNDLRLVIPIRSEVYFTIWRSNTLSNDENVTVEKTSYLLCLYKTKNLRTPVNNQTFLGLSSSIQDNV